MRQYDDKDIKHHINSVHIVAQQSAKKLQKRKEGNKRELSSKRYLESRFHNYSE